MAYLYLALAIVMELAATTLLKYSDGCTKLIPTISCVAAYIICYFSLSRALQKINLGVAYATWSGIGIVVTALLSALLFRQKTTPLGILGIVLIIAGCIILNLFGSST